MVRCLCAGRLLLAIIAHNECVDMDHIIQVMRLGLGSHRPYSGFGVHVQRDAWILLPN